MPGGAGPVLSGPGTGEGEEGRDWTRFTQGYGRAFALYGVLAVGVILLGTQQLLPAGTGWRPGGGWRSC
ncbi:MAG: hypothetical protein ACLVGW_04890 [Evtepia gabavorous]